MDTKTISLQLETIKDFNSRGIHMRHCITCNAVQMIEPTMTDDTWNYSKGMYEELRKPDSNGKQNKFTSSYCPEHAIEQADIIERMKSDIDYIKFTVGSANIDILRSYYERSNMYVKGNWPTFRDFYIEYIGGNKAY